MTTIVVYVEHLGDSPYQGSLDCLGAAHTMGGQVIAVLTGHGASKVAAQLGRHGATSAVVLKGGPCFSPGATAAGLAAVARQEGAQGCLAMDSCTGRDLIPRVAAHLDSTFFANCTDLSLKNGSFTIRRPCFSSRCIATWKVEAQVLCATLSPHRFRAVDSDRAAAFEVRETELAAPPLERIVALGIRTLRPSTEKAGTVVLGGDGLDDDAFRLLEELAATIGDAQVGATYWASRSRTEYTYVGTQFGGVRIAPRLCIAVGLNHRLDDSFSSFEVIVAIDKNPAAEVFKIADYAIVGDPLQVLPALIGALRELQSTP